MSLALIANTIQAVGGARNLMGSGTKQSANFRDDQGRAPASIWDFVTRPDAGWESSEQHQFNQNAALQREFAQMGIRWRVEDAKAAGLHPVFALGGQPVQASPIPVFPEATGPSGRGQSVSEFGALLMNLQMAGAQMEKDHAISEYYKAMAAKLRQDKGSAFPDVGDASGFVAGDGEFVHQGTQEGARGVNPFMDRRIVKPSVVTSSSSVNPSEESGTGPAWKRWKLNNQGLTILLPASSTMSEALESMAESKVILGAVIGKNVKEQGQRWMVEFMKEIGDFGLFD